MAICVLDTSVCVDLHLAGLFPSILKLPYTFFLPDVIIQELIDPPGQLLLELGIKPISLGDVTLVEGFANRYTRASVNDLFALASARSAGALLLTGDKDLREAAQGEGMEVHGTLWLLDELVQEEILTPAEAADALRKMLTNGSWFPKEEMAQRLRRWG